MGNLQMREDWVTVTVVLWSWKFGLMAPRSVTKYYSQVRSKTSAASG